MKKTRGLSPQPGQIKQHWTIRYRPYLIMAPALIITIGIMYPFFLAIFYSLGV